jgi:CDP-diacylglycerol--glycerol-3-phosphate 3-phosphatidyltransferase
MLNIPNALTLLRIALIPVLILMYFIPLDTAHVWATVIFILASITDWLDGYLARKWNQTSPFGAFLDPVADKLIVVIVMVMIVYNFPVWYVLLPILLIVARELTVSALREWMAELGQRNVVKVSNMGKWKTTFQMIALSCLIFHKPLMGIPVFEVGVVLLYVATWFTLVSMYHYLSAAWPMMQGKG